MSIFDQILGQVSSNVDVKNLAAKVGIGPQQPKPRLPLWPPAIMPLQTRLPRRRPIPGWTPVCWVK